MIIFLLGVFIGFCLCLLLTIIANLNFDKGDDLGVCTGSSLEEKHMWKHVGP